VLLAGHGAIAVLSRRTAGAGSLTPIATEAVGTLCKSDELLTAFLQLEAMFFGGNYAGSSCANI
jgi:hypothetical protein